MRWNKNTPKQAKPGKKAARTPLLTALEPRLVYDGAAVATAAAAAHPHALIDIMPRAIEHNDADHAKDASHQNESSAHAVLFVDSRVKDSASLLAGVAPGTEIVYLNQNQDGLQQMADYLAAHPGASSVQILAEGSEGNLWLGSTYLTGDSLQSHSTELAKIGANIQAGGDILVYACNTGTGADGVAFVDSLAALTGHNIAAANHRVGVDGGWDLEVTTGQIDDSSVLSASAEAAYDHDLSTITVTSNADSGTGSLRAAIAAASSGDTITFNSGMTITLSSGELLINKNLTIEGNWNGLGTSDVTINANDTSRVIEVASGSTVTLDGLIIENGFLTGAGGNRAVGAGGAGGDALGANIKNAGTLTISNSTITGGVAAGGGGAGGDLYNGTAGGGGGGGGGFGTAKGGSGGTDFTYGATAGTAGHGGRGGGYSTGTSYLGGAGGIGGTGTAGGGAGSNLAGYSNGGNAGDANNGSRNISGGGGGAGYDAAGGRGGNAVGGIYNSGTLTITTSSITNNIGAGGGGGGGAATAGSGTGAGGNGGSGTGAIWNAGGTVRMDSGTYATLSTGDTGAGGSGGIATKSGNGSSGTTTSKILTTGSSGSTTTNYAPPTTVTSVAVPANNTYHSGQTLSFTVDFSSAVTVSGTPELAITMPTGGTVEATYVSGSGSTALVFQYTILAGQQAASGITLGSALTLNSGTIKDGSGNNAVLTLNNVASTAGVDVQAILPTVNSIALVGSSPNNSSSEAFTVTYSEAMNPATVLASNFTATTTGSVADTGITVTEVDASHYTVTVNGVTGDGSLKVALNTGTSEQDSYGNTIATGYSSGPTYTIEHTPPSVSSINTTGATTNNASSESFTVTFSEAVTGVTAAAFTATNGGTVADTGITVTGSGTTYTVTVSGVTGDGTMRLDLNSSGTGIKDAAGNAISGGYTSGQTYTIEHTPPSVSSINTVGASTNGNSSEQFTVTFSEAVTGVSATDFTITTTGTVATGGITSVTTTDNIHYTVTVGSVSGNGTMRLDVNSNGTTGIADAAGNKLAATYSSGQTYTISHGPVITTDSGSTSFVAADNATSTPVVVDSGITVTDSIASLSTVTVTISGNFQSGADVLGFSNNASTMGNIAGSYNTTTGVLTLTSASSTANITQWQAALQAVTFTNSAVTPNNATRTISFSATDASSNTSPAATRTVTVTDTDQTPILTTSNSTTNYVGGKSAVAIDSSISVSDLDNSTQASATVSIGSGFVSGDTLAFTNNGSTMGNITASYNSATGVMTLTSAGQTATNAQWIAALDAVTFSASAGTTPGNRTIDFSINDGTKTSTTASDTVAVTAPPIVTTDSGSASFVAGDNTASTPVAVDSGITVTDASSTTLSTATVTITGGLQSSEDVLAFTNDGATMGNITSSYNASTGTLSLSSSGSTATLTQWQAALRAVTYTDSAVTPNNATRTISFSVTDANSNASATATRTVTVTDTDQTPILTTSNSTTNYVGGNSAVAIDTGIGVSDLDNSTQASATVAIGAGFQSGDTLAFTNNGSTMGNISVVSYNSATGVLTLASAGQTATNAQWIAALDAVTFSAGAGTTPGSRTINFTINDGIKTSAAASDTVAVTAPPIVTTDSGSASFVAGDNTASTPVAIDSGITVTDASSRALSSATVTITGGLQSSEDVLAFTNDGSTMGNITSSYNAATGTLSLSSSGSTATLAQWQAALRAVTYTDTAITPNNATRTISFAVTDANSNASATATRTVTVTDTDQTPIATTSAGSASFVAGDNVASTPVAIDSGLTVSDRDNATLASATVAITGNLQSSQDVLAFTNDGSTMGNITASYNASTGVLTLTSSGATATVAQWQAALQSITYTDTAITPNNATRTISFSVNDGIKTSAVATRSVTVTDTDQTPIVTTDSGSAAFIAGDNVTSTPVVIDGGITVSDRDNTTLASATVAISGNFVSGEDILSFTNNGSTMGNISASYNASTGVLTLTSSGATATLAQWQAALRSVTYTDTAITPNNATRTISFTVNDGTKNSTAATRTVTVADTDQTPIVATDSGSAAFVAGDNVVSTPVAIDSGITVSDLDNITLASANVAITGNFHSGEDVLSFTNTSSANFGNISSSYNASTGVLTLTSAGATATVAQWQAALSSVTYTDTAITPNNATRTISFTVNDGTKTSTPATRTVTVTDTDQTPIVTTSGGTTNYVGGTSAITIDSGVTVSDLDNTTQLTGTVSITSGFHSGDTLTFVNTNSTTFGNIVASYNAGTGVLTMTSSGDTATDAQWAHAFDAITFSAGSSATPSNRTVSFTVNDGTKSSAAATKTVDVLGPPTITTDGGSAAFVAGDNVTSTPVVIDSGITVTDGSGATLASATVAITSGLQSGEDVLAFSNYSSTSFGNIAASYNASTGVLTLTSSGNSATLAQWQAALRSVTYTDTAITPNNTTRTISFTATDATSLTSNTATRTVTVADTDQTPIVTTTGGTTNYVAGTSAATIDGGVTVSDLDNTTQSSGTVSITTGFHSGDTLSFTNTSSVSFGNIVGSYNAGTGVLTLTSSGDTANNSQWANAFDAVKFSAGSSAAPGNRTVNFVVNDGTKTSAAATDTVDVLGPPVVTTDGGSAAFVAGDNVVSTPVAIDSGLTLTDSGSSTLASATVAITGNFHSGEDVLAFSNNGSTMGNITASYNAVTGVLTLTSASATATVAQWQAALEAITYTDTAITPNNATRTISFTVDDANSTTSNTATRTVTVADTDQTPIVATDSGSASFVAGDNVTSTPVAIDSGIVVSDLDNTTLASATVAITGNFHSSEDVLAFSNTSSTTFGNIVASYNSGTGVLTLTSSGATATVTQWQSALRTITYTDTAVTPNNATRTISFTVNDGTKNSAVATRTVTVTDTDQTPIVTTDSGSASFVAGDNVTSTPVVIDSGLTVSDLDNTTQASASVAITGNFRSGEDVLAFTNDGATMGNIIASYNASTGVLSLTSSGATATLAQWQSALRSVTYTDTAITPNNATRTISFTVNDGTKNSTAATRTVTVTDTDQTPIASTSIGSTSFVAGDNVISTPVAIDSGLTVSDRDNTTLASATVAITGNLHSSEDVLAFTNTSSTTFGNIVASYNASTGILTLTSSGATATLAQWQAALRSVTYTDTAITPNSATRTISFTVNDGVKNSVAVTKTVTVADTDQTPIVTTSTGNTGYVGGEAAVTIDGGVTVSDRDNTTQASGTVSISSGFHSGDTLSFSNTSSTTYGNIVASYSATTGVLTLSSAGATATDVQWASALDAITFSAGTTTTPGNRTVSFVVNDGTENSVAATRTVAVIAPPILTTDSGSAAFVAGDNVTSTPIAIDSGITVTDASSTTLSSATVAITGNLHSSEDVLAFTNTSSTTFGNIAASYNSSTGILTLTSSGATATLAQWQAALQAVTYTDTAITPSNATRTISFSVTDANANASGTATRTITVADTDQTPIVTTDSGSAAFVTGDNVTSTPVVIDGGIIVSDRDNTTLASATVAITGNFHSGEDVLAFSNNGSTMGNVSASYNASTGVLTLTSSGATATVAQWQAALQSITYTDTAITPNNATRTISFSVNDGIKTSAVATRTVTVTDTDQTPIVTTDSGSAAFVAGDNVTSTPVVIDNGITVSDRDNTTLASATVAITGNFHSGEDVLAFSNNGSTMGNISASYNASTGVLTLSSSGATATVAQWQAALQSITYTDTAITPNNATRTVSFAVSDGTKTSAVATRTVTVTDTDQTPIVTTKSGSTAFVAGDNVTSTPVVIDSGIKVSDRDNTTLTSATVAITGNFHSGEDVLAFTNNGSTMGNISASYNAATGVLTLSSSGATATVAQWRAALQSITYTDTAITPNNATRTISFAVSDGTKTSTAATRTVTVTDTDQTPILGGGGQTSLFSQDTAGVTAAVTVANGITVSDRDNTTLASATVSITGGLHNTQDVLAFANTNGTAFGNISASYNASTGILTMTSAGATATLAQWQAALRAVTYNNTAFAPNTADRTISIAVNDGVKASASIQETVQVKANSRVPVLFNAVPSAPTSNPPETFLMANGGTPVMNALNDFGRSESALDQFDAGSSNAIQQHSGPAYVVFGDQSTQGLKSQPSLGQISVRPGQMLSFHLPRGTFTTGDAMARLNITLRQSNGQPLPAWLRFDPLLGTLSGVVPANMPHLVLDIAAQDAGGQEAHSALELSLADLGSSSIAPTHNPLATLVQGKPALNEQFKHYGHGAATAHKQTLLHHLRQAARTPSETDTVKGA